jgi:hypothetical protein
VLSLLALATYCFWVETNFDISRGWEKLIAVTIGGGAVLGTVWGTSFLLKRNVRSVKPAVSPASAPVAVR